MAIILGAFVMANANAGHFKFTSLSITNSAQSSSYQSTSETILGVQSNLTGSPVNLPYRGVQDSYHAWLKVPGSGNLVEQDFGFYTDTWLYTFQWVKDLPTDVPPAGQLSANGYNAVYINSTATVGSPGSYPWITGNGTISYFVNPTTTAPQCIINQPIVGYNGMSGYLSWAGGTPSSPIYNFQSAIFGGTSSIVNNNGVYTITFTGSYGTQCLDSLIFFGPSIPGMQCHTDSYLNYLWTISSIAGLNVTYN